MAGTANYEVSDEDLLAARKILNGLRINWMIMRDADSGRRLWQSSDWANIFKEETKVVLPKEILQYRAVSREMDFSSREVIHNFRLLQVVKLHGQIIEEWNFKFGFVIPGSTNTWQCVIEAAKQDDMIPAHILSGNVTIETYFFDKEVILGSTKLRLYYE